MIQALVLVLPGLMPIFWLLDGLLLNVNPTFHWVRFAQRIPVGIAIDGIPAGLVLALSMMCTVTVRPAAR